MRDYAFMCGNKFYFVLKMCQDKDPDGELSNLFTHGNRHLLKVVF